MKAEKSEIERTIDSLDGIKRPAANPLLFERIMNNLEKAEAKVIALPPLQKWSIAAGIALLILLNVFSLNHLRSNNQQAKQQAFASEYFNYLNNQ